LGWAVSPVPEEMAESRHWAAARFEGRQDAELPRTDRPTRDDEPFFSFRYDGKPSAEVLKTWECQRSNRVLDDQRTEFTIVYTDPTTGLALRLVGVEYRDFPVVEWTLYFKNAGQQDTPVIEDIQALDLRLQRATDGEFVLHGIKGDFYSAESYEPYRLELAPGAVKEGAPPPSSGKSCDGPEGWPYYNLQMPGGGVILAVGWPGQWSSSFARDPDRGMRIRAGQQITHLVLKPGEEIRTPLIAVLFWRGTDVARSQNLWRRWYLAHNLPRVEGQPQPPVAQIQVGGAESDIAQVEGFLRAGIRPDVCWRDAAWYPLDAGPHRGKDAWLNTGTWEVDPARYPNGFRPFSDWVHAHGMKFLLWFEPERVGDPNSWLGKNHPEWLLPGTGSTVGDLLNLGNPDALDWLIRHVSEMIRVQGIDWYREDMNGGGPLPAWRNRDAVDRQGITENFYVQGHLKFWDGLRRRHPHLRIDSCASGGRRNDLETMRRAVPLLRSDFQFPESNGVVEGNQGHTYGLSFWLPFQGTGVYTYDPYSYRSFYLPSFGMGGLSPENVAAQTKAYDECRRIAPTMLFGDYYPLTPYSIQPNDWIAWQFDRPGLSGGVIQAFRHEKNGAPLQTLRLSGLSPSAKYVITDHDGGAPKTMSGKDLMERGLPVDIRTQPGSAVIFYKRQ
jgi:alpha-galactosidase